MQNTNFLFNNPLPHPTINLPQIDLNQAFENYRFSGNSENDAYDRGWGSSYLRYYDAMPTKIDM